MNYQVLFVDDEPAVLESLRDALRRDRNTWQMTFSSDPEAAIGLLESTPFDVVVSDMRMPGIDGAQLLTRVQECQPAAVRVILSGYSESSAALRAASVAHVFLAKPCDTADLRQVLARAVDLRPALANEQLRKIAGGAGFLPAAPAIYARLARVVGEPQSDIHDIALVVAEDPALCAKLLQLVNSAFFGLGRRITSPEEAVAYLGVSTLRSLAISLAAFSGLDHQQSPIVAALQAHALRTAQIATHLAAGQRQADDAFLAGMLHDIGKLVLCLHDPGYVDLIESAPADVLARERGSYGCSHADVGGYLLALWGLPLEVVEAVARHHSPLDEFEPMSVIGAVQIANALAHRIEHPDRQPELGIDEAVLRRWQDTLESQGDHVTHCHQEESDG